MFPIIFDILNNIPVFPIDLDALQLPLQLQVPS